MTGPLPHSTTPPELRISVAMCTYNGSRFLPEQLASIAAQTRLPDEMVICDDGSMDSTAEIVEAFARSVSFPVRFIRNPENLGSTKNFEKAIGLCTGDLIALSDQDDIWMPEKLARQAEMMESDPELGGVFSDAELVDDRSQPLEETVAHVFFHPGQAEEVSSGQAPAVLLNRNVVTGATLMVRADLRPLFSQIPKCWYHDGWIAWMLVLYSKLTFTGEPLIRYRIHSNQQAGIGELILARRPTLRERLEKAKRAEPAKQLVRVRDLKELEKMGNRER